MKNLGKMIQIIILTLVLTLSASVGWAEIVHVASWNCRGIGSGTPKDPFCTIQSGINAAYDGDEVVIDIGTYSGYSEENINLDFNGKAITVRSTNPSDPDIVSQTVIDCEGLGRGFYFHSGEGSNSVVDGLTIVNGSVDNTTIGGPRGGGILVDMSSIPTIRNSVIQNNAATAQGGGIYVSQGSGVAIQDSKVIFNTSSAQGGGLYGFNSSISIHRTDVSYNTSSAQGGGLYGNSAQVVDSTISYNSAGAQGGGMYGGGVIIRSAFTSNSAGGQGGGLAVGPGNSVTVQHSTFSVNTSNAQGGGIYSFGGSVIKESIINDNTSGAQGGGIFFRGSGLLSNSVVSGNLTGANSSGGGIFFSFSSATIRDSIISQNSASSGGGLFSSFSDPEIRNSTIADNHALGSGGGFACNYTNAEISNSIFWGNQAETIGDQIFLQSDYMLVEYSDVQGGEEGVFVSGTSTLDWGDGNVDSDPQFVNPIEGDYHLDQISPAVDTGDPDFVPEPGETDIDGDDRVLYGRVDMGADEFATFSCGDADLNGDGVVDAADLAKLLGAWGENPDHPADLDGNGVVDTEDLALLIDCWGYV